MISLGAAGARNAGIAVIEATTGERRCWIAGRTRSRDHPEDVRGCRGGADTSISRLRARLLRGPDVTRLMARLTMLSGSDRAWSSAGVGGTRSGHPASTAQRASRSRAQGYGDPHQNPEALCHFKGIRLRLPTFATSPDGTPNALYPVRQYAASPC